MWAEQKRQTGFTIVELLIVIVVIGILAAITIVSFNGVTAKAYNAKVQAGVNAYAKAINSYNAEKGAWPPQSVGCLGSGYASDQCWSGPNGNLAVSTDLDAALSPYLSRKPEMDSTLMQYTSTDKRTGIVYWNNAGGVKLEYYLKGRDQKCLNGSTGTVYSSDSVATQCFMTLG
jgi:prepilin-type N-terminal cleavage/methylation domain-containing protein